MTSLACLARYSWHTASWTTDSAQQYGVLGDGSSALVTTSRKAGKWLCASGSSARVGLDGSLPNLSASPDSLPAPGLRDPLTLLILPQAEELVMLAGVCQTSLQASAAGVAVAGWLLVSVTVIV